MSSGLMSCGVERDPGAHSKGGGETPRLVFTHDWRYMQMQHAHDGDHLPWDPFEDHRPLGTEQG